MRNTIISLEKYFSIFVYLSATIWAKSNEKKNSTWNFFPNCNQAADRKTKIEKYLCKEIMLFLIYLGYLFCSW